MPRFSYDQETAVLDDYFKQYGKQEATVSKKLFDAMLLRQSPLSRPHYEKAGAIPWNGKIVKRGNK
jgi:hypothetical protein